MLKMTISEKWMLRKSYRTGNYLMNEFQAPEEVYEDKTNI